MRWKQLNMESCHMRPFFIKEKKILQGGGSFLPFLNYSYCCPKYRCIGKSVGLSQTFVGVANHII